MSDTNIAARIAVLVQAQDAKEAAAEIDGTSTSVKGLGNETERTSKKMKESSGVATMFSRGLSSVARAAKYAVGLAGVGGLAFGLKDAVDAATEMQTSQVRLAKTMNNAGISWKKNGTDVLEKLEAQARRTGFAMQDITDSYGNFVRTTGSSAKAFHLNSVAMDVARTKGMSLASAQSLLARVYNGSYVGLKRLGVNVIPITKNYDDLKASTKDATAEQIKHAKALDLLATRNKALGEVQSKFGGQAGAYAKTFAGSLDRLHVAVDLIEEKVGKKLLPILTSFAQFLLSKKFSGAIQTGFAKVKPYIDQFVKIVTAGFAFVKPWLVQFPGLVKTGFDDARQYVQVAVAAINGWLTKHRKLIQQVGADISWLWNKILKPDLKTALGVARAVFPQIVNVIKGAMTVIKGIVNVVLGLIHLRFGQVFTGIKQIVGGAWTVIKGEARIVLAELKGIVANGLHLVEAVFGPTIKKIESKISGIVDFVKAMPGKIANAASGIWDGLKGDLGSVVKWIAGKVLFLVNAYNKLPLVPNINTSGLQALAGQSPATGATGAAASGPNPLSPGAGVRAPTEPLHVGDLSTGSRKPPKALTAPSASAARGNQVVELHAHFDVSGKEMAKVVRRVAVGDLAKASPA